MYTKKGSIVTKVIWQQRIISMHLWHLCYGICVRSLSYTIAVDYGKDSSINAQSIINVCSSVVPLLGTGVYTWHVVGLNLIMLREICIGSIGKGNWYAFQMQCVRVHSGVTVAFSADTALYFIREVSHHTMHSSGTNVETW